MGHLQNLSKKLIAIVCILAVVGLVYYVAWQNRPKPYTDTLQGTVTDGTYTATEQGFGGDVTVTTEVKNNAIASINIAGSSETAEIGGAAIGKLKTAIYDAQTPYVDTVSGATITSNAVIKATENTLEQAGADLVAMGKPADATQEEGASSLPEPEKGTLPGTVTNGTYTAAEKGFGGDVTVTLTIEDNTITDVTIEGPDETPAMGGAAMDELKPMIYSYQTPNVDAVSGATVTSNAVINAAKNALTQAGVDVDALAAAPADGNVTKADETLNCDVVIVGAGGAGLTASIKLTQAGKKVILLEKMTYAGGNTNKATGGMNAAETHYQAEQNIEDSVDQFIEDTMVGGKELNNKELVTILAEKSADGIDWLDSIDAPLPKVSFSGGATNARIHSPEDGSGVGDYLVTAFVKQTDALGVEILYGTEATEILTDDNGAAVGVLANSKDKNYTINAKAVILATGGFGANEDMYTQYRPDLKGTVTTNAPGATGDGIVMATALGADTVDMEQIQLHPTVEQTTSMLITEGVRGDGAILVNQSGKRFTNELLTRDKVSAAELEQEGCYAYLIFDQNLRDGLKAIEKYVKNELVTEGATIEELAEKLDIDPATLKETLDTWNQCVADQKDPEFGRETGMEHDLSVAPYYAIKVAPGIHHTMGGIKINTKAEVVSTDGSVIPGLFAAGETTGGVHGGNRLGGNAVTDIVVFGTVAAESALEYIK